MDQDVSVELEVEQCSFRGILNRSYYTVKEVFQLIKLLITLVTSVYNGQLGISTMGTLADIYTASKNITSFLYQISRIFVSCFTNIF